MTARAMPIPAGLLVACAGEPPFMAVGSIDDLPLGAMRRFTRGDHDFLLAHTERGICVTDDRCPHMAAPLSLGTMEDCVVACPLHRGRFDLGSGEVVQFPTTGGLDPDGGYHPPWSPSDAPAKPEPTDLKAQVRAQTRVRRMRYYAVRISGETIEAQLPD